MKSWGSKLAWLAGAAVLAVAIPALSQERSPESLLPPGFGDPDALPPPEDKAPPAPGPQRPVPVAPLPPVTRDAPRPGDEPLEELSRLERPRPTNYFTIPEGAARPVDPAGLLEPGRFGLGQGAFGRSDGRLLATLMRDLDAPLPSRWTSILLRRALMSRLAAPGRIDPVDWVAVRADLLLRMGEADAARMLIESIDRQFYTPRMVEVAARTALATADPAGLCPLVGPSGSSRTVWKLADAMCAALEGEPARASALADEARRRGDIGGIDFQLAEKVIGAGAESRRATTLDWEPVQRLTPWRIGLAGATGAEIPARLVSQSDPALRAWLARAPMVPLQQRLDAASMAASLGIFSSSALVEAHSLALDQTDPAEAAGTVGMRLRAAWTERDPADRLEAMRGLWQEPRNRRERHARLILTAGAAARISPSADFNADAASLIASMLTAGMDEAAARWSEVVREREDDRAWALLAIAAPEPAVDLRRERIEAFAGRDDSVGRRRAQMLVAGLAGLGRIGGGDASRLAANVGLDLARSDRWSSALDRAARNREPGTVALLAGVGMQTTDWRGVPPEYLFRIVRALRTVGLEYEARMIAAEAVARL